MPSQAIRENAKFHQVNDQYGQICTSPRSIVAMWEFFCVSPKKALASLWIPTK